MISEKTNSLFSSIFQVLEYTILDPAASDISEEENMALVADPDFLWIGECFQ